MEKESPPPLTGSSNRKPANVEECITAGQFIGMAEEDCRAWYRDCELCEWKRGDGTPFDHWKRQMVIHRDKTRGQGHGKPRISEAPGFEKSSFWEDKTRLGLVEDEIKGIEYRASHTATEVIIQPQDRERYRVLRADRRKLKKQLGL